MSRSGGETSGRGSAQAELEVVLAPGAVVGAGAERANGGMNGDGLDAQHADRPVSALTLGQLIREITGQVSLLAKKQIELAKSELRADIKTEVGMIARFGVAALAALLAANMLFVAAALGLALVMPGWAAALVVMGALLVVAAVAALLGWRRRLRRPLAHTRETLKSDLEWTKEQIA